MYTISPETVSLISALSGIATIVASFVAIFTLLIWRKQQKYSHMLNAIMDLEDHYELLMHEYLKTYNWLFQSHKLASQSEGKSQDYKRKVNDKIKIEYDEFQKSNKLSVVQNNYQLAHIRADRFDIALSSYETLAYTALQDFFEKNLSCINAENFSSEESIEQEMYRFANNFSSFKKAGLEHFKSIRKSM